MSQRLRPRRLSTHSLNKSSNTLIASITNSKHHNNGYSILRYMPRDPILQAMLRVDHAGEVGANRIYQGQMAVLGNSSAAKQIQEMWDQEKEHVKKFEELLPKYRIRPTVLLPLWNVAGFALGAGTALLGKESAMACTVAVEEVIGQHYDSQLRQLLCEDLEKYKEILEVITQFRDEELEHHDIALENNAEEAPAYPIMKQFIQSGCRAAIWIASRI